MAQLKQSHPHPTPHSRAWREGFTITLVSGRTVGIGAYLARLGRRCVQRADQPIILTGYAALNKVLGRQVYTSHMQLGGPRVMGVNGVSHHVVTDDLEGVKVRALGVGVCGCVCVCKGGVCGQRPRRACCPFCCLPVSVLVATTTNPQIC